jgi:hypothetical protein
MVDFLGGSHEKNFVGVYYSAEHPPPDHEIYKMIERETGAVFDITWEFPAPA